MHRYYKRFYSFFFPQPAYIMSKIPERKFKESPPQLRIQSGRQGRRLGSKQATPSKHVARGETVNIESRQKIYFAC